MMVNKPDKSQAVAGGRTEPAEIVIVALAGHPIGFARTRHRGTQHFTPIAQRNVTAALKIAAQTAMIGRELIDGPVELDFLAEFAIPKSWSKKRLLAEIDEPSFPTKRPDYDNLAKLASDALNGVVYRDDAQIVTAHIRKRYARDPRIVISVLPL